jgi:hypothetical protein
LAPAVRPQQPSSEPQKDEETLTDPRAMEYYGNATTVVTLPIEEISHRIPHLRGIDFQEQQEELDDVLAKTGENVRSFFQNFPNTACEERIFQEFQGFDGMFHPAHSEKFRYLALNPRSPPATRLKEFRTDSRGNPRTPSGFFTTIGFVSTEAMFHPDHQSEALFRLLGRQKVKGRETFVVGFAQIPGKARLVGKATFGGSDFVLTLVQGVAWIDGENYQIIRMYTDLLAPRPDVGLKQESTDLTYEKVQFKAASKPLWLPRQVVVTSTRGDETYRSTHTYSGFRLFKVETGEKRGAVK